MKNPLTEQVFDRPRSGSVTRDGADWVIIGTGPAGATAAEVLTRAGYDVVMIEEGNWVRQNEFLGKAFDSQKKMYRDMGAVTAMGKSIIPVIQGRCVGGGSVINAAIIWRMPEDVLERWRAEFDIGNAIDDRELQDAFETIERDLNIHPVADEALGQNNRLLYEGAKKLGYESRIIPRNERGCQGLAQCMSGCPVNAKLSVDQTYVTASLERGARLYHDAEAHHIDVQNGRACRVHAHFHDPLFKRPRGRLAVEAWRGVILCASTVQTPMILWRSGIGMSSGHLGRHFQAHPGPNINGWFKDEVRLWEGASQGWDCEHFRKSERVKFECLGLPPDVLGAKMPGSGHQWKKALMDFDHLANVACAIMSEAEGTVRPLGGMNLISYSLTKQDMKNLRKGLRHIADIMVAAGAETILPGIHGFPCRLRADEVKKLDDASLDPRDYTMVMTHLFGTCRLGRDPKKSVVGPDFQVHDTRGVYVLDSSIFPTNLGVNPQHTIMGIAMTAARRLAAQVAAG